MTWRYSAPQPSINLSYYTPDNLDIQVKIWLRCIVGVFRNVYRSNRAMQSINIVEALVLPMMPRIEIIDFGVGGHRSAPTAAVIIDFGAAKHIAAPSRFVAESVMV